MKRILIFTLTCAVASSLTAKQTTKTVLQEDELTLTMLNEAKKGMVRPWQQAGGKNPIMNSIKQYMWFRSESREAECDRLTTEHIKACPYADEKNFKKLKHKIAHCVQCYKEHQSSIKGAERLAA